MRACYAGAYTGATGFSPENHVCSPVCAKPQGPFRVLSGNRDSLNPLVVLRLTQKPKLKAGTLQMQSETFGSRHAARAFVCFLMLGSAALRPLTAADWPMFGQNVSNTAYNAALLSGLSP